MFRFSDQRFFSYIANLQVLIDLNVNNNVSLTPL
jgi:hypothetical protein